MAIHRSAARLLRDGVGADEVTQEVFLRAWVSFDRFSPGTNCRAWLYRILAFTLLHYQRNEARFPSVPDGVAESLIAPEPRTEELTDELLKSLLARLPDSYRTVLVMVDLRELSYRETSEALQIPVGTVMSRLSRARSRMRRMILACGKRLPRKFRPAGPICYNASQMRV